MNLKKFDYYFLLLFSVIFLFSIKDLVSSSRYEYDEADYMFAASKGLAANYLDKGVIPLGVFLRKGLEAGRIEAKRIQLSEFIRSSEDISFYRHYHGPLYFYWLIVVKKLGGRTEYEVRWGSLLLLLIISIIGYFISGLLLESESKVPAFILSLCIITSPSLVNTAKQITPHGLYVLFSFVSLLFFALFMKNTKKIYWYLGIICLALSFLTIEYAPIILVTLIFCVYIKRNTICGRWERRDLILIMGKSLLLFVLVILIFWPGGLLKLTLLKNYLFFVFFAIFRGHTYGSDSFVDFWKQIILSSPIEYGLTIIGVGLFLYLLTKRRKYDYLLPLIVYSFIIFLTTFRNRSTSLTYMSSYLPPLLVIGVAAFSVLMDSLKNKYCIRYFAIIMLISALLINNILYYQSELKRHASGYMSEKDRLVNYFMATGLTNEKILIIQDFVPTVHYYFPKAKISGYLESDRDSVVLERMRNDAYEGILYAGDSNNLLQQLMENHINVHVDNITGKPNLAYLSLTNFRK